MFRPADGRQHPPTQSAPAADPAMNAKVIALSAFALFAALTVHAADIVRFPSDKAAVSHYLNEIRKRKPVTGEELFDITGINHAEAKEFSEKLNPMLVILDRALKNAGEYHGAKVIKVMKFGPMLQRTLFMTTYANNVLLFDIWFVNSSKGWQLVKFNFPIGEDINTTLAKIPAEFQTDAEGF
jgi:hypothetical protein